jgi:hypothetical protein
MLFLYRKVGTTKEEGRKVSNMDRILSSTGMKIVLCLVIGWAAATLLGVFGHMSYRLVRAVLIGGALYFLVFRNR